eukprot:Phypoly_transcript_13167.p1 GENE.Phypoly_transcript_13167~~Phypoly_transcript_13167.p1  ORF type:complete len:306 (+),score=35.94 Phypoly_transcript_13167:123-1040(+)
MLVLDYNTINAVRSGGGKRKAALIEDEHSREDKKAKQVNQCLIEASRKGDLGACIQAIRDGADVTFQSCGLSPLFYAAFYGHNMIIDYLVNCGANINEKNLTGVTPLGKAIESGRDLATVQCLLKHSADPNIADANGNTPLIKAVKNGNVELVKCLLASKNTDVNKQNLERNTALHEAAFKGIKDMVDRLLASGANVNLQNSGGKAPIHRAVSANHPSVVKTLLDNGAHINLQDSLGYTPCHYAAFFGLRECTELLVQNGASLELRDRISKKTCMELAQERRHYSVVEYLSRVESVPLLTVSQDP